ncbi:MAG TPA: HPr(Ser) kinase/phosphatase [bacterium]|jgi:HPr kinase/phosphorylase|nr:HPr(Ser) kinase/phosphatase [bacterium]HNT64919.1 HPr(Ser) kinase/phosphatase [bacterium]HOX84914.1 HPr(Ser) kinase/phosphatase [bacterium]HPG44220.1 HPr(Ser) kinase/phosphatase [bacterium]HPM96587.1 HPr(Ser) kinase/phosphatase [bacterium]
MQEKHKKSFITVRDLYKACAESIHLEIINSECSFGCEIHEKDLNRPGLALGGFVEVFTYSRVQIMGNTEVGYLNTLQGEERIQAISKVFSFNLPCVVITDNNTPPMGLIEIANQKGVTLFRTPLSTTTVTHYLSEYLESVFAVVDIIHGSLVDVYGVGMLILGESAIGKSELALDLIERGHQLVADDVVSLIRVGLNNLQGEPNDVLAHYMEVRGLGIIDIRRMFGIRAIRGRKTIAVVLRLENWDEEAEYERIGVDDQTIEILNVKLPLVRLPILPGKNLTVIAEAVALNQKLKQFGVHSAREFNEALIAKMKNEGQT